MTGNCCPKNKCCWPKTTRNIPMGLYVMAQLSDYSVQSNVCSCNKPSNILRFLQVHFPQGISDIMGGWQWDIHEVTVTCNHPKSFTLLWKWTLVPGLKKSPSSCSCDFVFTRMVGQEVTVTFWHLTTKIESVHPWVQVDNCAEFECIPSRFQVLHSLFKTAKKEIFFWKILAFYNH